MRKQGPESGQLGAAKLFILLANADLTLWFYRPTESYGVKWGSFGGPKSNQFQYQMCLKKYGEKNKANFLVIWWTEIHEFESS